jgi:hypothetical protein
LCGEWRLLVALYRGAGINSSRSVSLLFLSRKLPVRVLTGRGR